MKTYPYQTPEGIIQLVEKRELDQLLERLAEADEPLVTKPILPPTQINDGGPAFPVADSHHANGQVQYGANGMTLRDYFAGQALAMLADPDFNHSPEDTARLVYRIADAMLAAREVKP